MMVWISWSRVRRVVSEGAELRSVADTFEAKYGRRFTAPDGTWFGLGEAIRRR